MTQKEKDLLLKDLCSRLPYEVKIRIEYPFLKEEEWHPEILYGLDLQRLCIANTSIRLEEIKFKPYLFPLSSMTEEQKTTHNFLKHSAYASPTKLVDWYNKNHFDYRGLIPMDLALDATGLNIY